MLTARDEKESRIKGLEIGADDYLAKPFEPRELSLRVASILRRARPPSAPPAESVRFGPFVFHLARGELRRGEEAIRLTDREREMLRVLAASVGETVPRQALAGNGDGVSERTVDVQVNRLRRKIEQRSGQSAHRPDRTRRRLSAGGGAVSGTMTSLGRRHRTPAQRRRASPAERRQRRSRCRRHHCSRPITGPVGPLHPVAQIWSCRRGFMRARC